MSLGTSPVTWSWSWCSSCGRQSVDQSVWVSGLPLGPLTRFYLALLFSADKYLVLFSKASSLTRKRVCSLQCNHSYIYIYSCACAVNMTATISSSLTEQSFLIHGLPQKILTSLPVPVYVVVNYIFRCWLRTNNSLCRASCPATTRRTSDLVTQFWLQESICRLLPSAVSNSTMEVF
jgi:hypothetical protein